MTTNKSHTLNKLSDTDKLSKNFQKTFKNKLSKKSPTKNLDKNTNKNKNKNKNTHVDEYLPTTTSSLTIVPEYTYDTLPDNKNELYNRVGLTSEPSTTLKDYKEAQYKFVDKVKRASKLTNVNIAIYTDKLLRKRKPGDPVRKSNNVRNEDGMKNAEFDSLQDGDTTGTIMQVPLRTAFRYERMSADKNAISALSLSGNLCRNELDLLVERYGDELTYNERAAIDLVKRAVDDKDPNAIKLFWEIQTKVAQKTNIANQINIAVASPNAMMTTLLDQITDSIKNANDAPPVQGDEDVPPVTI